MNVILGAGLTGLGAARTSGFTVVERESGPGGICRTYYRRPGSGERLLEAPADGEAYRFEVGGGHWLFGGDAGVLALIERLTPLRRHRRRAAVWLRHPDRLIPYPLQQHTDALGTDVADRVAAELATPRGPSGPSMAEWLRAEFGATLFDLFFGPFHQRYTAGLLTAIQPQDAYKSPTGTSVGYNREFAYPAGGLDRLTRRLAGGDIRYGHEVTAIHTDRRVLGFADGAELPYDTLLTTLPLDVNLRLAGLDVATAADPHTSVLVLNVGATRGPTCPDVHWLYEPASDAGFHRLGFYSNVDTDFLPRSARTSGVALYVERAYVGGDRPDEHAQAAYVDRVVAELQERGYIGAVDVIDPTWVEVAYTWTSVGSDWRRQAISALEAVGVQPVGRYARWHFQGMADSLAEGMAAGRAARARSRA